ncbi:MAG: hypothetical protein V3T58_07230 [Candidatus Hydrothermarchaeales archaeon]
MRSFKFFRVISAQEDQGKGIRIVDMVLAFELAVVLLTVYSFGLPVFY